MKNKKSIGNLLTVIDKRIKTIAAKEDDFTIDDIYELSSLTTAYLVEKTRRWSEPILSDIFNEYIKKEGHRALVPVHEATCDIHQEGEE